MATGFITTTNLVAELAKIGIFASTVDYAGAAYRAYPAISSYAFEPTGLLVNPNVAPYNSGASSYLIENRYFNQKADGKNVLAEIYMPSGVPVTIRNCVFATDGDFNMVFLANDSDVRVDKCIFMGTGSQAAGTPRARAIYGYQLRNAKVTNCVFLNTAGCLLETWSSQAGSTQTVTWLNNRYDNICGGGSGNLRQALQLQHVQRPGIEIAYNQITNTPGASRVEDIFNFGESGGTSDSWLHIHHNLLDGAYPANPTDGGFTGSGITTDAASASDPAANMPSYILAENNYVLRTMNSALNIAAGHDVLYQNNKVVVCGVLSDGTRLNGVNNAVGIFKGQGYSDTQFFNNRIINNNISVNTANGEQPYYSNSNVGPGSSVLTAGNTLNTYSLNASYADEQALVAEWKTYLAANRIWIGVPQ